MKQEKCQACRNGAKFDLPITMAFQPMVALAAEKIFTYEALPRGKDGAGRGMAFEPGGCILRGDRSSIRLDERHGAG